MVLGLLLVTWIAGRIYRTGILMYGKKPTIRELLDEMRDEYATFSLADDLCRRVEAVLRGRLRGVREKNHAVPSLMEPAQPIEGCVAWA